jgi:Ser/Thr protein kinase RdoA (MazF antagonist)
MTDTGRARRLRPVVWHALADYGLAPTAIRQIAIDTNYIFKVTADDGRAYALRVQRPGLHTDADTELECWWVRRLAADGLPVAAVVTNRHGRFVTVVDDVPDVPAGQRCVLFDWLQGSDADDGPLWFWTALGELAARLHEQSIGLQLPAAATPRRWDCVFPYEAVELWETRYDNVITAAQRAVLRKGIATLDPLLAARYDPARPVRLLHGDLHDDNVRVSRRRLSVFDFEDLIVGHPEHDLAVALYGPYYNRDDLAAVVAAMRSGYERVAPWPITGIEELRPLFAARALGLINYCLTMGDRYVGFIGVLTDRVAAFLNS